MANALLNELARALVEPEGGPEWGLDIGFIVAAHNGFDVLRGLTSVVEGDGGDQVMADVGANDVMEKMGIDEAEVAIDGGSCATGEIPGLAVVMRHGGVGVLEEGNGD